MRSAGKGPSYRKHGRRIVYHIEELTSWSNHSKQELCDSFLEDGWSENRKVVSRKFHFRNSAQQAWHKICDRGIVSLCCITL